MIWIQLVTKKHAATCSSLPILCVGGGGKRTEDKSKAAWSFYHSCLRVYSWEREETIIKQVIFNVLLTATTTPRLAELSWAVVWNCTPSPFSPPLYVLGMTSVWYLISYWLVQSGYPGCEMNPILAKLRAQVHLFFIAFPFSCKCPNPSFWKNLGICLLMKTGPSCIQDTQGDSWEPITERCNVLL